MIGPASHGGDDRDAAAVIQTMPAPPKASTLSTKGPRVCFKKAHR